MPLESIVANFKPSSLRDHISELLTEAILSGRLRPGDRMNESALARQLRVSRAPIREALQQLEEQGLVMNQPRRGMFVVSLDETDLQKINSLRIIMEAEALRLCRAHATPQIRRRLQQISEKMERSHDTTALEACRMDLEFHRTLWSFSGNEYLEKVLTSLTAPLFAYAVLTKPQAEKMRMILDSHRPLVDFVACRYERTAEDVMYQHLQLRWTDPDRYSARRLDVHAMSAK